MRIDALLNNTSSKLMMDINQISVYKLVIFHNQQITFSLLLKLILRSTLKWCFPIDESSWSYESFVRNVLILYFCIQKIIYGKLIIWLNSNIRL